MQIQWFPGHMSKTVNQITADLNMVDCVVMMLDARCPHACENPLIVDIVKRKPVVYVANKADLADDRVTSMWRNYYLSKGFYFVSLDSKSLKFKPLLEQIKLAVKKSEEAKKPSISGAAKRAEDNTPKRIKRRNRIMIVGIPNVGKSTLINSLSGKAVCRTGNKPGVTKGKQWIRLRDDLELLDTPGVLWHKFDDEETGIYLAMTGAIKDEILEIDNLALMLAAYLKKSYPDALVKRYKLDVSELEDNQIIDAIAKKRGFLLQGGLSDTERSSRLLLDEFRNGLIGKISLQKPADIQNSSYIQTE